MTWSAARMPRPSDVPRSGPRRSIAATSSARSSVGTWVEKPVSLKTTMPMRTELGWPVDERERRGLGGLHAGRGDVGGRHAARDVEREDDRALEARDADDALRPSEREDEDRDAERR